ncbi:hypothetical protein, partial [Actinomadura roseirufa]|uniref:hypothetical protein n=1 Tax=Actinomadura roseirufa TaxID=2094049 RepID=UPI00104144E9
MHPHPAPRPVPSEGPPSDPSRGPRIAAAEDLPVASAVPALRAALAGRGAAVLAAPPGTGKTTLVPLALAGLAL